MSAILCMALEREKAWMQAGPQTMMLLVGGVTSWRLADPIAALVCQTHKDAMLSTPVMHERVDRWG